MPRPLKILLLACLLGGACQGELTEPGAPATAREWVEASARHHDPAARWPAFRAEIAIATTLPGGDAFSNAVLLDRARDTFRRRRVAGGYTLVQTVGSSGSCTVGFDDPGASAAELARVGIGVADPCIAVARSRAFYDFLVGLPMSALGPSASFGFGSAPGDRRADTTVFGVPAVPIRLTFPEERADPTWWLYFDPDDAQLLAARFVFPDGGGEWLYYPTYVPFDCFSLRAIQEWYTLDGAPVSVDVFAYRVPE